MIRQSNQGAVSVVTIEGPLQADEAEQLREVIRPTPGAGRPQVVLDLAETTLIDSSGCEGLLDAHDSIAGVGGAVHLAALNPLCHDVLIATGVIRYFQAFENSPQAVAQFSK